eukprot:scaffold27284_cov67-Skeletonema_dohrnii-CCMP3373.AAC.1
MQSGRKVPVRLLMFLYPFSFLDVGGEVTIGVIRIARQTLMIIMHRCNIQTGVIPLLGSEFFSI